MTAATAPAAPAASRIPPLTALADRVGSGRTSGTVKDPMTNSAYHRAADTGHLYRQRGTVLALVVSWAGEALTAVR